MHPAHLYHNKTFIEPNSDLIRSFSICDAPRTFQRITQRVFKSVRVGVPDFNGAVFAAGDDDGKGWMEYGERNVGGMRLESLDA
jgi:hypothetical protein